jgi:crossover junction endodeoxyribonuclease RuvC
VTVIGIDPGMKGAIAYVDQGKLLTVADMPEVGGDLSTALLHQMVRMHPVVWGAVERVHSMPKQGVSTTFKFGMAYGMARAAVGSLLVPMEEPTPNVWKKMFNLSADKEKSRLLALKLFPDQAVLFKNKQDHGRAEAALIALWCERLHVAPNYADSDGAPERVPRLRLRIREDERNRLARRRLAR